MKKSVLFIVILAAVLCILPSCGEQGDVAALRSQLTSGSWLADMSEGTTASYTFKRGGDFVCDAAVEANGETATLSRSGSYEIEQADDGTLTVHLQYPNVGYVVDITCQPSGDAWQLTIAGCTMYQK